MGSSVEIDTAAVMRRARQRELEEAIRSEKIKMIRALFVDKGTATVLMEHLAELHCEKQVGLRRPSITVPNGSVELWFGPRMSETDPVVVAIDGGYTITKYGVGEYLIESCDGKRSMTLKRERSMWRLSSRRGFVNPDRAQVRTRSRSIRAVGMY